MKDKVEIIIWLAKLFVIIFVSIFIGMELFIGIYTNSCWYSICTMGICLWALLIDIIYEKLENDVEGK